MPTISVIVPVYKVEKFIHRCVDSILAQTFRDFELILVDDGSPDNCPAICDEYATKDSRITVIHQENGGLSAARNAGIDWTFAQSDSQWLTFIDSDDWVHPEYLQRLLDAAVEHNVSVSVCSYIEATGTKTITSQNSAAVLFTSEDFFVNKNTNAVIAWAKLYRKDCFHSIRYPVGRIHEDEFVTYRILFPVNQLAFIPAPLYYYYINVHGITKSGWTYKRLDVLDALEQQISYFQKNGYIKAYRHQVGIYIRKIDNWLSNSKNNDYEGIISAHREHLAAKRQMMLRTHYRTYMHDTLLQKWHFFTHLPNLLLLKILGPGTYEKMKNAIKKS